MEDKKAKFSLEVVSTDVWGSINSTSHTGKRYFVTFIDQFSHFSVCYFLMNQYEVFDKFKYYIAMIEMKFGRRKERLRYDDGGEYISKEMKNFCLEK